MSEVILDHAANRDRLMKEILQKTRELQDHRVQDVLKALAKIKNKDRHIRTLEEALATELSTHRRHWTINTYLELLETDDTVSQYMYK